MNEISVLDGRRLLDNGAVPGDGVVIGYASTEDARLAYAEHQREWVERLLPCIDGVHAVIESGQSELLVACDEHALPGVLAVLLEQGFTGVRALDERLRSTPAERQ